MYLIFSLMLSVWAMPANQLQHLTQRLDDASFSSDQIEILQNLPKNTKLSCAETVKILKTFSFPADQKKAVTILLPYLTDLENRHLIMASFTFQSDKTEIGTLLDVEYANRVEAAQLQEARDTQKARQNKAAQNKAEDLKIWETRLQEFEKRLQKKAAELDVREAQLEKEAQRLAKLEADLSSRNTPHSKYPEKNQSSKAPKVEWVGYCPQGLTAQDVAIGQCMPFDAQYFNPLAQQGQRLLLQVSQPGTVELKLELGPETQNCKQKSNITSIQTQKIKVSQANQVVDVGALIPNWYRESLRITAQSGGYGESIYLEDWQNCK